MPPKVGITWDAEADRKILLAVLRDQSVNVDWEALAAELSTEAGLCTVSALRKHISRLRTAVKDTSGAGEGTATPVKASAAPITPAKKPKAKPVVRKRAAQFDDEDEEEFTRGIGRNKAIKTEPVDDDANKT